MKKWVLFFFFISASTGLFCKDSINQVVANRVNENIKIDGCLTEYVWKNGNSVSKFTQRDPDEGKPSTQKTEVRVAYDETALYIGARMFDTNPDSIIARLSRRDDIEDSDRFFFFIDPYNDKRSGYYFALNAAGTYYDGILLNDDWDDNSWDGVWEGKVQIDDQGWTAEMKIPFSQLRFHQQDKYTWGVNFNRDISRNNEVSFWVYTPKDGSGFVSRFPSLVGIENIHVSRNIELLPYFRTKAEYMAVSSEDPFNDGSRYLPGIGGDIKFGIGSNLTLDATINPDFGQVEVDPAVVNLSDVETFYDEKRPFFIEGASIFNFGQGGARSQWGFNWGNPDFFYSRRLGRSPQGTGYLPDYDYADIPNGTTILGAAKLTGKVGDNWNIGTVHAITNREYANLDISGSGKEYEVEPFAYYGVARAQKEFDEGRQGLGFISTFTGRNFKEEQLHNEFNKNATTFGIDGWTFWDEDKVWVTNCWLGMSHINGTKDRIMDLQESSRHYLQRPDRENYKLDPDATSLTGFAGRVLVNKQKGNVIFNSALGFVDPRFDNNDLGFMWRGDIINGHIGGGYKWTNTTEYTRYVEMIGALFATSDFDYNITWTGFWTGTWIRFLNYYFLELRFAYNPETINNRRTRGGPLTINPSGWEYSTFLETDNRKPWVFGISTFGYTTNSKDYSRGYEISVECKPTSNLSIEFAPEISFEKEYAQWVDVYDDPFATHTYEKRYVFAELDYTELSASIRLNWTFTPKLSFQLYTQPLISTGDYKNFKELAEPKSYDFTKYGDRNSAITKNDDVYIVDPDGNGPAQSFEIENPDFNFKSIRANAVLRWEYLPGSTLYLVWTQSRTDEHLGNGEFHLRRAFDRIWSTESDNIFMVKLTYWMNM
ncbi:DUF5916 domain-containing protein [Calditrichota bacterium]